MRAANISVQELLEGSKVYTIPLFQRPYTWGRMQWKALWANLVEQYEFAASDSTNLSPSANHFIGSFVFAPAPGPQSPPRRILVVDGQQRLITLSLLLAAIRDIRWEQAAPGQERRWLESDFGNAYLVNSVLNPTPDVAYRVLPTQDDREPFIAAISSTPGEAIGRPGEAYNFFKHEVRHGDSVGADLDLELLTTVLLTRLTLVEITTERGDNVHRVFQTLNSSGVLLRQIDLLRNHFFMLLPTRGEELYREVWRDMELRLGESALDRFMWASLVPFDQRVSRKSVFATMQRRLEREGPWPPEDQVEGALRSLNDDSKEYLKLIQPDQEARPGIQVRLKCLAAWGTDTYHPLGLALLKLSREERLEEAGLERCLLYIESFLVRRMLCGIPTNNLNRIFSRITSGLPPSRTEGWLFESLQSAGSPWPSDAAVQAAVIERPFMFSGQPAQRRFVLTRIEGDMRGEQLPDLGARDAQAIVSSSENGDLSDREFDRVGHNLGNATLVSRSSVPVGAPFAEKREAMEADNLLINATVVDAPDWTERRILERSVALADRVLSIWPGPSRSASDTALPPAPLADIVALMPEDGYTTVHDLAELTSEDDQLVLNELASWPAEQAKRVVRAAQPDGGVPVLLGKHFDASSLAKLMEQEDASYLEELDL